MRGSFAAMPNFIPRSAICCAVQLVAGAVFMAGDGFDTGALVSPGIPNDENAAPMEPVLEAAEFELPGKEIPPGDLANPVGPPPAVEAFEELPKGAFAAAGLEKAFAGAEPGVAAALFGLVKALPDASDPGSPIEPGEFEAAVEPVGFIDPGSPIELDAFIEPAGAALTLFWFARALSWASALLGSSVAATVAIRDPVLFVPGAALEKSRPAGVFVDRFSAPA